jgi:hypothetical protein
MVRKTKIKIESFNKNLDNRCGFLPNTVQTEVCKLRKRCCNSARYKYNIINMKFSDFIL